ncbi:class I SAM-dependent methyltransferase [Halopseudomonas sp.]|uniref:class I SAM-dependent methyltransferase n=1 Tax=Halopseudomonas sp. TaxID=2901191 RepID=UPI0031203698
MSLLLKIPGLRIVARLHEYITRLAPLEEFDDYDAYWQERAVDEGSTRELDRFKVIAGLIQEQESVLDIGCGDASFQQYLARVKPGCKSLGLDASSEAVRVAQEHGCATKVIDTDLRLLEQVGCDWDVVTLMEVLEHIPDAESVMRQVIELRPRRIFVTIPNVGCLKHRFRLMFGGRFPITTIVYHMREHLRFWTVKDFEQWAETFGLEVCSVQGQFSFGDDMVKFAVKKFPAYFAPQVIYELRSRR